MTSISSLEQLGKYPVTNYYYMVGLAILLKITYLSDALVVKDDSGGMKGE
jgi:hypothetical protein